MIITDYATNLLKIARWIEFIDQPRPSAVVEFLPIVHVEASEIASQLQAILAAKAKVEGREQAGAEVDVSSDPRTNQLLLVGRQEAVDRAKQLVKSLDLPSGIVTRTYAFQDVAAARIDQLVQQLIDPLLAKRAYRSVVDEHENLLVATTTEEIHRQIEQLKTTRDVPVPRTQSPLRFYKVKNLPAIELLETIRSIERESQDTFSPTAGWQMLPTDGRIRPARRRPVPGPNRLPARPGEELPKPPAQEEPENEDQTLRGAASPLGLDNGGIAQMLGRARVTADIHTNTLIVVAEPSVQRLYAELIEQLDRRRPQVLIEAKFVVVNTSDDFSLGVEVSGGDRSGAKRLLAFTSYGLSTVDPVSGALSIIPGLGFNGTLVDPDVADAVLRALTTHSRARVFSAPRILVNDNATGQLTSVQEVPFKSVNASQTVATTSFAGYAEAGTTITVTPRIGDAKHLQLDFAITVNTFTGGGSESLPPPRQTEEVTSQVTIPDGHTVIVGGLRRGSRTYEYTGFPFLDRVPLLRELSGITTTGDKCSSMFIFIRPIVLRDDKFRDLKYVSDRDGCKASIHPQFPTSRPIWIR